jgi:nitroreductase
VNKDSKEYEHELYDFDNLGREVSLERSKAYREEMSARRSVRFYSDKEVDRTIIENILMTASSAPSGANKQPWSFAAVSSMAVKQEIRKAAEAEEYKNYHGRMSEEWVEDLEKFGTDWNKPFLTTAPWLIVIFKQVYELLDDGSRGKNYYVSESVGIAAGMLISAIHHAGLVTLTHTPSPMNFLEKILERPANEKAYLLLPVGYPANDATVPVISRKTEGDVISYY